MLSDLACRGVVRLVSWIVPPGLRAGWHGAWRSCLESLRILIDRGELPGAEDAHIRWFCRGAFTDAIRLCGGGFAFHRFVRGPAFLLGNALAGLLILTACTRGFAITRALVAEGSDTFVPYALLIAFALVSSITIAVCARLPLRGRTWRYWGFLLLKTACLMALVSLVWIEGGFLLRRHIANDTVRALGGGLILAAVFVAAFGWAVLWSLGDQQRRCPVCLRRMAMPVRIGSWSSVFEPVTTELLCEQGHGSLYVQECELGEPDRWLAVG